jgi:hypothetical protein
MLHVMITTRKTDCNLTKIHNKFETSKLLGRNGNYLTTWCATLQAYHYVLFRHLDEPRRKLISRTCELVGYTPRIIRECSAPPFELLPIIVAIIFVKLVWMQTQRIERGFSCCGGHWYSGKYGASLHKLEATELYKASVVFSLSFFSLNHKILSSISL